MSTEFTVLIPGLPEELALECLSRLHYSAHQVGSGVCRRWRELLRSRAFYYHRKQTGHTRKMACFVQSLMLTPSIPLQSDSHEGLKLAGPPPPLPPTSYGLTLFDPTFRTWERIDPIPMYPEGLPLFCQVASSEGKLVVMGGWDPASWSPITDVFVYDFTTRTWTRGKDMQSKRSFFAAAGGGATGGIVFVAGGHDESKNALRSAWAYNVRNEEWRQMGWMSEERDECEGIVIGSEFWVVSGYDTESQGGFTSSAEVFDVNTGRWRRVEGAWKVSQCPRSCVGVGKGKCRGNLINWAEFDPAVRVGACGVDLGDRTLVAGSAYQGAQQGFYLYSEEEDEEEGLKHRWDKIDSVPEEFLGFVQSGCCVEI